MISEGALVMLLLGCLIFYGGLVWCLYRALTVRRKDDKRN